MKIVNVTSTDLKTNTARILNSVTFGDSVIIIERHGKPVAKITPYSEPKKLDIASKASRYFGAIPDFAASTNTRHFRGKKISLD